MAYLTVKLSSAQRAEVALRAKLNGPNGRGLKPEGSTLTPGTVMVRRAGTVVAVLDLSRSPNLKVGR